MRHLGIGLLICVLGVAGCVVVPPSAETVSVNKKTFYVVKSGTTKGGAPVGVVIAIENNGNMETLGVFTGRSTAEQILSNTGTIGNATAGYFIGRGLRHSGNTQMQGQIQ